MRTTPIGPSDVQDALCTKTLYVATANEERFGRSGCLWNAARQDFPTLNTASSFTCGVKTSVQRLASSHPFPTRFIVCSLVLVLNIAEILLT